MSVSFAGIRGDSEELFTVGCPTRVVLDHIMSKWGVLVLLALTDGRRRWGALRRDVEGISEKMLAQTLRVLESDGLVARHAYPEVPPRVEYELTPRGVDLMEHMGPLVSWVAAHAREMTEEPTSRTA